MECNVNFVVKNIIERYNIFFFQYQLLLSNLFCVFTEVDLQGSKIRKLHDIIIFMNKYR